MLKTCSWCSVSGGIDPPQGRWDRPEDSPPSCCKPPAPPGAVTWGPGPWLLSSSVCGLMSRPRQLQRLFWLQCWALHGSGLPAFVNWACVWLWLLSVPVVVSKQQVLILVPAPLQFAPFSSSSDWATRSPGLLGLCVDLGSVSKGPKGSAGEWGW